jgi:hypothetical protein
MPSEIHPALARELRQSKRQQKFFTPSPTPRAATSTTLSAKSKKKTHASDAPSMPLNI